MAMLEPTCVLYYPTIQFNDVEWIWTASLLYDKVYRIVPPSFRVTDPDNLKQLFEAGDIGINLDPEPYVKKVSTEFMGKIEAGHWDAAAMSHPTDDPEYASLHRDKVDEVLRHLIIESSGQGDREMLAVPRDFAGQYMTYLAREMAQANSLHLATDSVAAWTASTYFQYDGQMDIWPHDGWDARLAALIIRDFIPVNILDIRPRKLLEIRKRYPDERRAFINSIQVAAKRISACRDPKIIGDLIKESERDINRSLAEFRKTLSVQVVDTWTGAKAIPVSVGASLLGVLANINPLILVSTGVAMGIVHTHASLKQKKKKLMSENPYSYLDVLNTEIPHFDPTGGHLAGVFHEFIDD